MTTYETLHRILCAEQQQRSARQTIVRDPVDNREVLEWILAERRAILDKVNEIRQTKGLDPITEDTLVRKAEWAALGHSDYTSKYALYASDLADGRNETVPATGV